jgi:hypothetical protein
VQADLQQQEWRLPPKLPMQLQAQVAFRFRDSSVLQHRETGVEGQQFAPHRRRAYQRNCRDPKWRYSICLLFPALARTSSSLTRFGLSVFSLARSVGGLFWPKECSVIHGFYISCN